MTKGKKIYSTLLATCLAFSVSGLAFADQGTDADLATSAASGYDEPAPIDRAAMIDELVAQWGSDDVTAYQLRATLEHISDSKLVAVWQADSVDAVNTILTGAADLDGPLALGDTDQDYVFTPVSPCRIVDTRTAGGAMTAGSTREFYVYGPGVAMTPQGGNAAGCTSPVGEPLGVMINVTAVPIGSGNLRAYPADESTPTASLVNYKTGTNIANAAAVKTYAAPGPKELEIYSSADSHVIIDVMGYYSAPEPTTLDRQVLETAFTVAPGSTVDAYGPQCPTGYVLTGGGNHGYDMTAYEVRTSAPSRAGYDQWYCRGRNYDSSVGTAYCISLCARVPGR